MNKELLKVIGVPNDKIEDVWKMIQTPSDKENARREALKTALIKKPLEGLAVGGSVGLGVQQGLPFAEVALNPAVRKGIQGISKRHNLGDMSKGPLFPVFTALGTAAYLTSKELINYHKRKKAGDFG